MNKSASLLLVAMLVSASLTALIMGGPASTTARAAELTVGPGGDHVTIQDAINNASSGDTIYVWAGTYYENVVVNKTLTIIGNGSAETTINGSGSGSVVTIISSWVNITGMRLIGSGSSWAVDAGLKLVGVQHCRVEKVNVTGSHDNGGHSS